MHASATAPAHAARCAAGKQQQRLRVRTSTGSSGSSAKHDERRAEPHVVDREARRSSGPQKPEIE